MVFPKISKYTVYNYNGEDVILWQQDLFIKTYLRTLPQDNNDGNYGSRYFTVNWWKFMFNAKVSYELEHNENSPY